MLRQELEEVKAENKRLQNAVGNYKMEKEELVWKVDAVQAENEALKQQLAELQTKAEASPPSVDTLALSEKIFKLSSPYLPSRTEKEKKERRKFQTQIEEIVERYT